MKKNIIFTVFLVLLILISGCKIGGKKDAQKALEEIRTGIEGIVINFQANAPPAKIHVEEGAPEETNTFDVVLELKNKGAFPQPEDKLNAPLGDVYISGFDRNIIEFTPESFNLNDKTLEGKSTINPNGGLDIATFKGKIKVGNLNVEKYEPTLLATACYTYTTIAGQSVCIDPNPYSTIKEKKVCEVQDITLSNQGAPVAVTKIDEEALATKTQLKITIKNVGGGDVIKSGSLSKCSPSGGDKLLREDIDKVQLEEVRVGNAQLNCRPFVDSTTQGITQGMSGFIRLINGEGFIICEFPKTAYEKSKTAFTTPIKIKLSYIYRNTAERKILIKKEISGDSGGGGNSIPLQPTPPEGSMGIVKQPDGREFT